MTTTVIKSGARPFHPQWTLPELLRYLSQYHLDRRWRYRVAPRLSIGTDLEWSVISVTDSPRSAKHESGCMTLNANDESVHIEGDLMGLMGVLSPLPSHDWELGVLAVQEGLALGDVLEFLDTQLLNAWWRRVSAYYHRWNTPTSRMSGLQACLRGFLSVEKHDPCWGAPRRIGRAFSQRSRQEWLGDALAGLGVEQVEWRRWVPEWIDIETGSRAVLGVHHHQLGRDLVCGERVLSYQSCIHCTVWVAHPIDFFPSSARYQWLLTLLTKSLSSPARLALKIMTKDPVLPRLGGVKGGIWLGWGCAA